MTLRALLFAAAILAAPLEASAQISVTDDTGITVSVARAPQRIVSLAPNATEMVFAAGAGPRLVATVATSDFPPPARQLPRIGDAASLDLERILALQPDLVVTWPYTVPTQLAALRARGIPIFTIDPRSVQDIAGDVERLGILLGTSAVAQAAAAAVRAREDELQHRFATRPPVRVFYEVWPTPLVTLGGRHLVSRALETCGGRNVFATLDAPAPNVSIEAVLEARPEAIVAGADGGRRPAWLDDWRRWSALPAVAHGNLFAVNADLLHRSGPRFVDGVAELCDVLEQARAHRVRATAAP